MSCCLCKILVAPPNTASSLFACPAKQLRLLCDNTANDNSDQACDNNVILTITIYNI